MDDSRVTSALSKVSRGVLTGVGESKPVKTLVKDDYLDDRVDLKLSRDKHSVKHRYTTYLGLKILLQEPSDVGA